MQIQLNHHLVLLAEGDKRFHLVLSNPQQNHNLPGLARVSTAFFLDKEYGVPFMVGMKQAIALPPTLDDRPTTLRRKAQMIVPKDVCSILYHADIGPGQLVVELGSGSGAMSIALAQTLGSKGRLVSYDIREDFSNFASENVRKAGLGDTVQFKVGDAREGIDEEEVDRVMVDIPDPWEALPHIHKALKLGGILCLYLPSANQVIRALEALEQLPFVDTRVITSYQQEHKANHKAFRPDNLQLVHTAYLIFARKVEKGF